MNQEMNHLKRGTTTSSFKWVFSTTILRRLISFLLFLYIVRVFSRADIGIYRTFAIILSFASLISVFGFHLLNIVEKSRKYLQHGLQFVLLSSVVISVFLFFLRGVLAEKYGSSDLYLYILFGFWLVIPLALKRLVRSLFELDMNFKYLSIAETMNSIVSATLALLLFLIELKFYYFVIAFFVGEIIELGIIFYPLRSTLATGLYDALRLKFVAPLKSVLKEHFAFLSLTTIPTALNMFIAEAPILLMGLFFLPEFIGNYFVAAQLVIVPISFFTASMTQVLFPAFSLTKKEDLALKIGEYIRHIVLVIWTPTLFLGILIKHWGYIIVGNEDIHLIVSLVIVLVLKTLIVLIFTPLTVIPTKKKKPQYELYWSIGSLSVICVAIYLLRDISFLNMFYFYICINVASLIAFILMILKMVELPLKIFFDYIWRGIVYTFPLMISLFLPESVKTWMGMSFMMAGVVYSVSMLFFFEKEFFVRFWKRMGG